MKCEFCDADFEKRRYNQKFCSFDCMNRSRYARLSAQRKAERLAAKEKVDA